MPEDQKMQAYIGTKIVCAEPMDEKVFIREKKMLPFSDGIPSQPGYLVVYPDGYESWSPKETFEAAYRLVSDDERRMV